MFRAIKAWKCETQEQVSLIIGHLKRIRKALESQAATQLVLGGSQ